jgi:glycosyltransferase involved in cell wall biosynthesis
MPLLADYELHLLSKISDDRRAELVNLASTSNVIFHNGVSEAEYLKHLDDSIALVSASRDEGFGIPVIEAMGRGCPAIISDIEIFREIGSDAAIYFDQESPQSFADAVRSIEKPSAWKAKSIASLAQANKFNWQASADELIAAIETLY